MKKCPLCENKQYKVLYNLENHKIVNCTNCNLVRTLGGSQVNYKAYHRDTDYQKNEKQFKNIFRKRFNLVKKFKKTGKVLDIGTSTGTMLDIFKDNGWETYGVEPSVNAQIAQKKGHNITKSNFENAKLKPNFFDAVVMNHILEHVEDPLKVMKKINKILKKDGVVLIDVPNFASLSSKILKKRWPYILVNEHNYHFTPQTLKKLTQKAGLKTLTVKSRSGIFEYANPFSELWQALSTLKKRLFTDLFGAPGAAISTLLHKGTSFSLIAIKK